MSDPPDQPEPGETSPGRRRGRPVALQWQNGISQVVLSITDDLMWLVVSAALNPQVPGAWLADVYGPQPGHGSYGNINLRLTPDGPNGTWWMNIHFGIAP